MSPELTEERAARPTPEELEREMEYSMLSEALSPSPDERAALAGELIQSFETEVDPDAEAPWLAEIRARDRSMQERP